MYSKKRLRSFLFFSVLVSWFALDMVDVIAHSVVGVVRAYDMHDAAAHAVVIVVGMGNMPLAVAHVVVVVVVGMWEMIHVVMDVVEVLRIWDMSHAVTTCRCCCGWHVRQDMDNDVAVFVVEFASRGRYERNRRPINVFANDQWRSIDIAIVIENSNCNFIFLV